MEQFNPAPFMDALNRHGLPWKVLKKGVFKF
jgi:saccharopine dehydrogenase-like NADP-dependent oxidoreductase